MEEKDYLESFETRVKSAILLPVEDLDGDFMMTDDLLEQWHRMQQEYMGQQRLNLRCG